MQDDKIEILPLRRNPREGWADEARAIAERGEEGLVWPEIHNEGDQELVW